MNNEKKSTSFTERAAWLTAANFIGFAMMSITPFVIVRLLDPMQFGIYKQLFLILTTTLSVLNLQVASSAYYFMPRAEGKQLQVALNIILFYAGAGMVVAIIFLLFPGWAGYIFNNQEVVHYIPQLGLAILLWAVSANLEVIPLSLGDVRVSSTFIVLAQVMKCCLLVTAAVMFRSVRAILWASIIEGAMQSLFMMLYIRRKFGALWRPIDWQLFKQQIGNALPFGTGSTIQGVQSDLHNYFVSYYFSPIVYATYVNGCFQLPLLSLLQYSFAGVLIPEVAQMAATGNFRGIVEAWLNAMRKLAMLILPICALMFVLRYEIITTLFTKAYANSVPIFSIYLVNLALLTILTGSILRAFDEFRFYRLKLHLVLIPVSWLSLYTGIKWAGLIGAVTATVLVQTIDVSISLLMAARKVELKVQDLKHLAPLVKTLLAIGAAAILTYTVKLALGSLHPFVVIIACGMTFVLIYLGITFAAGGLTESEKLELREAVQKLLQKLGLSRIAEATE